MWDFFSKLFDTSGFPPRWHCGIWTPGHGWLHIISDVVTFLAYTTIPIALAIFTHKKRDLPFPGIFRWFALFILACGTVHLIEATIFWHPWYRLSGLFKAVTAVVSTVTVIMLIPIIPKALSMKSREEYEAEVAQRQQAEVESKMYASEFDRVAWLNNKLKLLNDQLRQRNAELDEFTHVASHDLRAPLRAIRNLADWITEEAGEKLPQESTRHLALMNGRVVRMERLLDDLLEFSRAGRQGVQPKLVDTNDLINEIVQLLPIPDGFQVKKSGKLPSFTTAKTPLATVFRNLIDNALKHHDQDTGAVVISARQDETHFYFEVADDGPGIPTKYHEKVFKMFHRLKSGDDKDGSGAGLAVVKKIVVSMGGNIHLRHNTPRGCRFEFSWPMEFAINNGPQHEQIQDELEIADSSGGR